MKHLHRPNNAANALNESHRSRSDQVLQLAYYRLVARRLREADEGPRVRRS